jgi:hypothetical protein
MPVHRRRVAGDDAAQRDAGQRALVAEEAADERGGYRGERADAQFQRGNDHDLGFRELELESYLLMPRAVRGMVQRFMISF